MTFDELVKFIQGIGFPSAVAFFVLWKLDASLRDVRDEIRELRRDLTNGSSHLPPSR